MARRKNGRPPSLLDEHTKEEVRERYRVLEQEFLRHAQDLANGRPEGSLPVFEAQRLLVTMLWMKHAVEPIRRSRHGKHSTESRQKVHQYRALAKEQLDILDSEAAEDAADARREVKPVAPLVVPRKPGDERRRGHTLVSDFNAPRPATFGPNPTPPRRRPRPPQAD